MKLLFRTFFPDEYHVHTSGRINKKLHFCVYNDQMELGSEKKAIRYGILGHGVLDQHFGQNDVGNA